MRNWNKFKNVTTHLHSVILVVPYLWGIETPSTSLRFLSTYKWLYLTYEELKLVLSIIIPPKNFVVPYLWGIETHRFNPFSDFFFCCTLPMRNWNIYMLKAWQVLIKRCTLPMRNWNGRFAVSLSVMVARIPSSSLYLTYEELKPFLFYVF